MFAPETGNLGDVTFTPQLPPNSSLYSWTSPPPVLFMGWLLNGRYTPTDEQRGLQLRAFYRRVPDWAPQSPGENYIWTTVSVVRPGGWSSEIQ